MSNNEARTLAQKADITVSQLESDGGYLNPERFDQFYEVMMEGPTNLINSIRTVQMSSPQRYIDKIAFAGQMLRPAPEAGTPLNADERYRPQFEQIKLDTEKFIGEFFLPYDVIEDNIAKGDLENVMIRLAGRRVRKDISKLLVLGDTTSNDQYLSTMDGALILPDHKIDGGTISNVDKNLFETALKNLPDKFHEDQEAMRFYLSVANELNYRSSLAGRQTAAGDEYYLNSPGVPAFGSCCF